MPVELNPPMSKPQKTFELKGVHVLAMLLAFFGMIGIVNAVMINLALTTLPGTQTKSAFEDSQKFNRQLDAIAAQDARGWQVDIMTAGLKSGAPLVVNAHDKAGETLGGLAVSARIERPTNARFDHALVLKDVGGGRYVAALPELEAGQWLLTVEMKRGSERVFVSQRRVVIKE